MSTNTQIGGKYDKADSSIFELKKRFMGVGIHVSHPMSDEIISTVDGRGFTFDPVKQSFLEVEEDYYKSIAASDFHTVNNRFLGNLGYVGGSASLEMAYAMVKRRPILLMHNPSYAESADPFCVSILTEREDLLRIHDLSSADDESILRTVDSLKDREVDYRISAEVGSVILGQVDDLFRNIRENPW